jgi:hypothetical protein
MYIDTEDEEDDEEDEEDEEDEDSPTPVDFTEFGTDELVSLVRDMIADYGIQGELHYVPDENGYKFVVPPTTSFPVWGGLEPAPPQGIFIPLFVSFTLATVCLFLCIYIFSYDTLSLFFLLFL